MNSLRKRLGQFFVAAAFLCLVLQPADAQRRSPTRIGRNSTAMKSTLEKLVVPIEDAICELKNGSSRVALGTVVSSDGLIISKLSEVESIEGLTCNVAELKNLSTEIVAKSERYDLALIKVKADGLTAIDLDQDEVEVAAGRIVLSANENGRAISMGLTTVAPRRFEMRQPRARSGRGFLGVECSPVDDGLEIGRVTPGSGAQKAGLRRSDVLVEFEGKKVPTVSRLIELLESHSPEDKVAMLIEREEKEQTVTVRLGRVPTSTAVQDRWGGGPFSERRFGFPKVIVHDCAIKPNDCGGPLLDSDGKVIGINIARALRVATYAVPLDFVFEFVKANSQE